MLDQCEEIRLHYMVVQYQWAVHVGEIIADDDEIDICSQNNRSAKWPQHWLYWTTNAKQTWHTFGNKNKYEMNKYYKEPKKNTNENVKSRAQSICSALGTEHKTHNQTSTTSKPTYSWNSKKLFYPHWHSLKWAEMVCGLLSGVCKCDFMLPFIEIRPRQQYAKICIILQCEVGQTTPVAKHRACNSNYNTTK